MADAQASGACGSNTVWVQVPSSAVTKTGVGEYLLLLFVSERIVRLPFI